MVPNNRNYNFKITRTVFCGNFVTKFFVSWKLKFWLPPFFTCSMLVNIFLFQKIWQRANVLYAKYLLPSTYYNYPFNSTNFYLFLCKTVYSNHKTFPLAGAFFDSEIWKVIFSWLFCGKFQLTLWQELAVFLRATKYWICWQSSTDCRFGNERLRYLVASQLTWM